MQKVSYIYPPAYHYRLPFNEKLRSVLAEKGVEYTVVYSDPFGSYKIKSDTVEIKWGNKVPTLRLFGGAMQLQMAFKYILDSDLIIIQQENKLLLNYVCIILNMIGIKKVAYFGHGRNYQSETPNSLGERWKKFWATKVHWWFGYTSATGDYLVGLGFPQERITVFNNSIDTKIMAEQASKVTPARLSELRESLGIVGKNTCIYVGGVYKEKRISFLVESLDVIRQEIPNFEFILVGSGVDINIILEAAKTRSWIKVLGPKFGREKVELMLLGKLFLMPGLLGLAILDAGVLGLPIATTNYPYHSPEIAYLKSGVNGVVTENWKDSSAYARDVVSLLKQEDLILEMSSAARKICEKYSIESMASNFAAGVDSALRAKKPFYGH